MLLWASSFFTSPSSLAPSAAHTPGGDEHVWRGRSPEWMEENKNHFHPEFDWNARHNCKLNTPCTSLSAPFSLHRSKHWMFKRGARCSTKHIDYQLSIMNTVERQYKVNVPDDRSNDIVAVVVVSSQTSDPAAPALTAPRPRDPSPAHNRHLTSPVQHSDGPVPACWSRETAEVPRYLRNSHETAW